MTHQSSTVIIHSMLDPFDPANEHYQGVRDHFSAQELERIDAIRAYPETHQFTIGERLFISYMLGKAVMTAANPDD